MAPDLNAEEYAEFQAWKASHENEVKAAEKSPETVASEEAPSDKPLTDTEAALAAGADAVVTTDVADPSLAPAEEESPADQGSADTPVDTPSDKPLTDTEARQLAEATEQGQSEDAGADVADATTGGTFDPSSYEFGIGDLVKWPGATPDTFSYGFVVMRGPMPTATPEGVILPGYKIAALGLANSSYLTSQDLGLEKA